MISNWLESLQNEVHQSFCSQEENLCVVNLLFDMCSHAYNACVTITVLMLYSTVAIQRTYVKFHSNENNPSLQRPDLRIFSYQAHVYQTR